MYVFIKLNENITIINTFYICSKRGNPYCKSNVSLKAQTCEQIDELNRWFFNKNGNIVMFLSHSALCLINI